MTDFIRAMRRMLLEVEGKRGRPMLLAARVPETLAGCHFDGLDVQTWTGERLLDIFVLGCRSLAADVYAFRRITAGGPIKVYVSLDDHHSSDGYNWAPIEVFRGAFSNWYRQGADGVQAFNFNYAPHAAARRLGLRGAPHFAEPERTHRQAFQEMGDPAALRHKDKTFVLQRRGGGHGPTVVPNPEDWSTPRYWYANSNMLAPLPAALAGDGKADTLLKLFVGDDVNAEAKHIASITMRVLLNDPATRSLPADAKIDQTVIRHFRRRDFLRNSPPTKAIEDRFELRLNNAPLGRPIVEAGWLVFENARPTLFAVGDNLLGLRLRERLPRSHEPVLVEKLEVHVRYRQPSE